MSAQTTYKFDTTIGEAGGILDIAPYEVNSFTNEENTGVLKFGVGVVAGTKAGAQVKLPGSSATAATFEGVVTNRRSNEYDMDGKLVVYKNASVGVMSWGRIYVRVVPETTVAYGDALYMVVGGTNAGYFTNDEDEGVAIAGKFVGTVDAVNGIAAVELFHSAQPSGT